MIVIDIVAQCLLVMATNHCLNNHFASGIKIIQVSTTVLLDKQLQK